MNILFMVVSLLGAFSTVLLAKYKPIGTIRASAITSIIAYCLFLAFTDSAQLYGTLFFGGTFIGMSAPTRFGVYSITSSAIIFSLLFEHLIPIIKGFGGALGMSAFLSVCICHMCILVGAPRSKKQCLPSA
jgi:hypothetical protein